VLREAVRKRGVGRNNAPPAEVHDDRRP